jgi:ABC-type glycerol-3-phosphate transport system substrate-binding protein
MRKSLLVAIVAAAAIGLTACGTPAHKPAPAVTVTETATPAAEPAVEDSESADASKRQITEIAIQMTWDDTSEADRDAMCGGIELLGTDWAADQLRSGGGTDATLDWDYAAELVADKCTNR